MTSNKLHEIGLLLRRPRAYLRARRQLMALPPHLVRQVGMGDFRGTGRELVSWLLGEGLRPTDRVLDLGCGVGRVAIPLQATLGRHGSYDGVDVSAEMIEWAEREITRRSPRFRFHHLDLYNGAYNPAGRLEVEDLELPFGDDRFDLAWATSLFTHLLEKETVVYFGELARVLAPGGLGLFTFFLLDDASREQVRLERTFPSFPHRWARGRLESADRPEAAVAFDLEWVVEELRSVGLEPRLPHYRGTWSGRERRDGDEAVHRFQDYLAVRKVG